MNQNRNQNAHYAALDKSRWDFHFTKDIITRFLRDYRLENAFKILKKKFGPLLVDMSVLIVCGGVGGEAIFFQKKGFKSVTNSDVSESLLIVCSEQTNGIINSLISSGDPILAEADSFDIVIVQDGIHHLARPAAGVTEMIRVAKKAVVVIEPSDSIIGSVFGTKWENNSNIINYVFRWDKRTFEQVCFSFTLKENQIFSGFIWSHPKLMSKISRACPKFVQLPILKFLYFALNTLVPKLGNNFIGIVIK